MIKISKRLEILAEYAYGSSTVCDVGCDHGLLAIYLIENNYCAKVICSDINENPLEACKKNVKLHNLEDKIEIIKSNGIEHIKNKVDTAIIAGMGGMLICDILNNRNLSNINKLVIQANSDVYFVRKFLMEHDYRIVEEKIFKDKQIFYTIIFAIKGKESLSETELNYGKYNINKKDTEFISFLNKQALHYESLLKQIPNDSKKYSEINHKLNMIHNVLNN